MIELVKLHHVSLASKDLSASRTFFGDVLGLAEIPRPGFTTSGIWYSLGDRQLHIIKMEAEEAAPGAQPNRSDHLALEVADVEAVRAMLHSHGIAFEEGGNRKLGLEQIFCRDPDGRGIEFIQTSKP